MQPSIPPDWQTYANSIYSYQISYPPSWHLWGGGDPRISQYLSNYDESTADNDFEEVGTNTKIEISPLQKSTGESLYHWLQRVNPNFWAGGPIDEGDSWVPPAVERGLVISGLPAILLHWSRTESEYLDAGAVVYKVVVGWAMGADINLARQILSSFKVTGTANLAEAAIPHLARQPTPLVTTASLGMNLPMQIDYAWGGMPTIAMNAGGANSWYDHDSSSSGDYHCNNSLTRFDGNVFSPNWCSTTGAGSCTTGTSCYDGHPGIDFSTRCVGCTTALRGVPVYAVDSGTMSVYNTDKACGNGLYLSTTEKGHSVKVLFCHLDGELVTSGAVSRGQEIALSGCSGSGCGGAHLHMAVYRVDISPSHRVDPFGWCGSGSDPDPNDIGYLWSTGSVSSGACNNAVPTFIGGPIYTVIPILSANWCCTPSISDSYGVTYWYTGTAGATATWNPPSSPLCVGAEIWVPAGHATNTSAPYVLHFSDGTSQTVTINQNNNQSWYTIYDGYNGGKTITQVVLTAASGSETGVAKAWFQCFGN